MLTTKPIVTVKEHFRQDRQKPKYVQCLICERSFNYRSNPEMLKHLVGGHRGFEQCKGDISPSVYKKYEQQLLEYTNWTELRQQSRTRRLEAAASAALPDSKRCKQSKLFTKTESTTQAHLKLANCLYLHPNVSARFMESPEFRNFLLAVPRNYTPPSASTLLGSMLDAQLKTVEEQVSIALNPEDPDVRWWANIDVVELPNGSHMLAITLSTPFAGPFLVHAVVLSKTASKNAGYLCDAVSRGFRTLAPSHVQDKLLGFTTDNESAMTTMWDKISDIEQFAHLIAMPCDCHGFNLAYKDMCKEPWAAELLGKAAFLAKWARDNKPIDGALQEWSQAQLGFPYRTICVGGVRACIEHYSLGRTLTLERGFKAIVHSTVFLNLRESDNKVRVSKPQHMGISYLHILTFRSLPNPFRPPDSDPDLKFGFYGHTNPHHSPGHFALSTMPDSGRVLTPSSPSSDQSKWHANCTTSVATPPARHATP